MKKFITLSAALMAVSVVAVAGQPATRINKMAQRPAQLNVSAQQLPAAKMPSVRINNFAEAAPSPFANKVIYSSKKNAAAANDALYTVDGLFEAGIWYYADENAFGYSYNGAYLFGQAFKSQFIPQTDYTAFNFGDYAADEIGAAAEDGTFNISPFGCPAAYYMPTLMNGRSASYTYGDYGQYNSAGQLSTPSASIFYAGTGETMSLGAYEMWTGTNFYSAYKNTPAYGSYLIEEDGVTYASNTLLIDLGSMNGCVIENIEFACLNHEDVDADAIVEGDTLQVLLIDYSEDGSYYKEYKSIITVDQYFKDVNGWGMVQATFTEVDEDGFETEINPVVKYNGQLIISGFLGKHIAIPMIYREDDAARYANEEEPIFRTKAFSDYWIDGEQYVDENGIPKFYGTPYTDCVLNFNCHFSFIGSYDGNTVMEGFVPEDAEWYTSEEGVNYTLAVSTIVDGEAYNDFDIAASFNPETWSFDCDDCVYGFEVDDQYYEDYGIYIVYVALTEDIIKAGKTTVTVTCNEEVSCDINIAYGNGGSSIKRVNSDNENTEVYNLQGVKVGNSVEGLAPGVYVRDGKKFVK